VSDDTDYDALGNCDEQANGTSPTDPESLKPLQLGAWHFDTTNWTGVQGQVPITFTNLGLVSGIGSNAVRIDTNVPAWLTYSEREPSNNIANINLRKGTLRFWMRPSWSSGASGGPQTEARLVEVGTKGTTNGWWSLVLNPQGTNINFCTQTNTAATLTTNLTAPVQWVSNQWHQVVLTYSTNKSALYIDGQPVFTNGAGVSYWPGAQTRALGFRIGGDMNGTNLAKGSFDELETYNYAMTAQEVASGYPTPMITTQPVSQIVPDGGTSVFSVVATCSASFGFPLSYQWFYNSNIVADATNATLTQIYVGTNQKVIIMSWSAINLAP